MAGDRKGARQSMVIYKKDVVTNDFNEAENKIIMKTPLFSMDSSGK